VLLRSLACASAVCERADLLSLTRALQLYRFESQHPPRHPPPAINAQVAGRQNITRSTPSVGTMALKHTVCLNLTFTIPKCMKFKIKGKDHNSQTQQYILIF